MALGSGTSLSGGSKVGIEPPLLSQPLQLAYHDACHLAHAQGVVQAPRRLLGMIPNLVLLPIAESDLCCGSAGLYNIEQPEVAGRLGERKVRRIMEAGAQAVATGNIGCIVQIRAHLSEQGKAIPVWHALEVLDLAYREWS